MSLDSAFGSGSAGTRARINALEVEASLVVSTLFVCRTLGVTAAERISKEVGWAGADCTVIANVTFGIGTAGSARILATESCTSTVCATFKVGLAFPPASLNWVTDPSFKTRANGSAVLNAAL